MHPQINFKFQHFKLFKSLQDDPFKFLRFVLSAARNSIAIQSRTLRVKCISLWLYSSHNINWIYAWNLYLRFIISFIYFPRRLFLLRDLKRFLVLWALCFHERISFFSSFCFCFKRNKKKSSDIVAFFYIFSTRKIKIYENAFTITILSLRFRATSCDRLVDDLELSKHVWRPWKDIHLFGWIFRFIDELIFFLKSLNLISRRL